MYVAACGALYVCCNSQLCSCGYLSKYMLQGVLQYVSVAAGGVVHVGCNTQLCAYSMCCNACCSTCMLQRVVHCMFAATRSSAHVDILVRMCCSVCCGVRVLQCVLQCVLQ